MTFNFANGGNLLLNGSGVALDGVTVQNTQFSPGVLVSSNSTLSFLAPSA